MNTFYTSPRSIDRSTDSTSILIKEHLHLLPKYIPYGISSLMTYRFLHRTGLPSYRSASQYSASASPIGPNRNGPRLLQPTRPMLSLSLYTPPQAQLEALRDLPMSRQPLLGIPLRWSTVQLSTASYCSTRSWHSRERTRIRTWIGDRRRCQPNQHRCSRLTARLYLVRYSSPRSLVPLTYRSTCCAH